MHEALPYKYYGDDIRWFVGVVVNATPPPALYGRVKVRIHGIHNPSTGEVQESDLPWAQVLIPSTEGGVSGIGGIPQLLPGASVFGYFLDGKSSQLPIIVGSFPRIEFPTSIQKQLSSRETSIEYDQDREQNFVETETLDDQSRLGSRDRRRSQSIKFFIDNGYIPIHAAAITGCLESASQFAIYEENQEDNLQGIAKWPQATGPRFKNLVAFAANYNVTKTWRNFSIQLQYVLYELRTNKNLANVKLLQQTSIENSVNALIAYYAPSGVNQKDSKKFAERAYDGANE